MLNPGVEPARLLAISTLTPLFSGHPGTSPFQALLDAIGVQEPLAGHSDQAVSGEDGPEPGSADEELDGQALLAVTAGLHSLAFTLVGELAEITGQPPLVVLERLALQVAGPGWPR